MRDGRPGRDLPADDPRGRRSRCWPARASARRTRVVFGGFSAEALDGRASRTRRPSSSSPPTAATGAGTPAPLKPAVDEAVAEADRASSTCWSCGAPAATSRGPRAATCGGTTSSSGSPTTHEAGGVRRRAPAVHPLHVGHHRRSRRASCTPPAATSPRSRTPTTRSSTSSRRPTCTGAPPTSAGSPGTPTSSTGRWPTAPRQVMYEGTPDTPHQGRWWEIVEKYRVSILYTAPTAIRTFMKWGDDDPGELRPVLAAAARAASASRSTPRPGCGTASHRRRPLPRSSTPGGRPRPARS